MSDELVDAANFTNAEKEAVLRMVGGAVAALQEMLLGGVDSIALIINDHEGSEQFTTEIWINEVDVVNEVVGTGVRLAQARWLYQHWRPEAVQGEVLSAGESPTHDRGRYYSMAVEAARQIRKRVPEIEGAVILVDNNHDYDALVVDAITAANPDGQAAEWLAHPPPDC
ncbi:hypothetical protein [Roseimicrobium sp. ORNL1]|uniref:hypothetical protein n=1 Tax=Roseimicrobium sp. ORNL1 TaxID=2711231 RepID=UPI0013E1A4C7|nr:hypothetical protein [Roseimicrobium sp. ORNL1]QIF05167.1 hypothetical protein G5S37_27855 [Roseimicrobium sp. ORNL1]